MSSTPPAPPPSPRSGAAPLQASPVRPASPLARLGGLLAEALVVGVATAIMSSIEWLITPGASSGEEVSFDAFASSVVVAVAVAVLSMILGIVCLILMVLLWSRSTSPGKKIAGLGVVDVRSGAPASMGQMLLRELVGKYAVGIGLLALLASLTAKDPPAPPILFVLVYATAGFYVLVAAFLVLRTPTRQATWDFLAKTTVVKVR